MAENWTVVDTMLVILTKNPLEIMQVDNSMRILKPSNNNGDKRENILVMETNSKLVNLNGK